MLRIAAEEETSSAYLAFVSLYWTHTTAPNTHADVMTSAAGWVFVYRTSSHGGGRVGGRDL